MPVRSLEDAKKTNKKLDDVQNMHDFLNESMIIWDVDFKTTKYGAAAYVTISKDEKGEKFLVLTHSLVVLGQLERFQKENELPLLVTLVKVDRYYQLQ